MTNVVLIRRVGGALLLPLLAFYMWFTFRSDGALMTVPGIPKLVWGYFDHHTNQRNAVGFIILGSVASVASYGLGNRPRVLTLTICLIAPFAKDCAQIGLTTRHFNAPATLLGMAGSFVGFYLAAALLSCFVLGRVIDSEHERKH